MIARKLAPTESAFDPVRAASRLVASAAAPHRPFGDLDAFPELDAALSRLPLAPALALPEWVHRRKLLVRGIKDARLKAVLARRCGGVPGRILNPCSVFSRHARDLARRLPESFVEASDITALWHRLFAAGPGLLRATPPNFRFSRESVYDLHPSGRVLAVAFFGGCGSMTDAALRLAIASKARLIVGRSCCHENIGMNTTMSETRPTPWSVGHRVKNRIYRACADRLGHYGHRSATASTYPLSRELRARLSPDDMRRCAMHAVDCEVCRAVIDLDRCAFLAEQGYAVLGYAHNMFVAERAVA